MSIFDPRLFALFGSLVALFPAHAQQPPDLPGVEHRVDRLEKRVNELESALSNLPQNHYPKNLIVRCDQGESVTAALSQWAMWPGALIITVQGMCAEQITIGRDNVSVSGQTPDAGFRAPAGGPDAPLIGVAGGRHVVINSITLRDGTRGLGAWRGASVSATNLRIRNMSFMAVGVNAHAEVFLGSCLIENANGWGVNVREGGHVTLTECVLTGIKGHAVGVAAGSTVRLSRTTVSQSDLGVSSMGGSTVSLGDNTVIEHNGSGLIIYDNATVEMSNSRIAWNTGGGVLLRAGHMSLQENCIVEDNGGPGLSLRAGSIVRSDAEVVVRRNQDGFLLSETSILTGAASVLNNRSFGIQCIGPLAQIEPGSSFVASGNPAGNIVCPGP